MKCNAKLDEVFSSLLSGFFRERVGSRNVNANTFDAYRTALTQYLNFLVRTGCSSVSCLQFNAETVVAFLDDYLKSTSHSIRSRNLRLAALKSLANYAGFKRPDILDAMMRIRSIRPMKYERKVVEYLTRDEMMALLTTAKAVSPETYYPLFLFMYHTGARVSEVVELTMAQLDLGKNKKVLIHGKGNKYRSIPLRDDVVSVLSAYVSGRSPDPESSVFLNRNGCAFTRNGVSFVLRELVKKTAETETSLRGRRISPHCLRHTTAMHLLQSGVDINTIRLWLGHVSIETTNIYVEADLKMKRDAIAKAKIPILTGRTRKWNPTEDTLAFLESL